MKRPLEISQDLGQIETIRSLTGVFENIASLHIGRIKDQVLASERFFSELWHLYSSLRVEAATPALQALAAKRNLDRTAFVVITSEGGLSGDVDQRIIEVMRRDYKPDQVDLVVIGYHGVVLLQQHNLPVKKFFRLPSTDAPVNVTPVINQIARYKRVFIYYQRFVSLAVQRSERIALLSAVRQLGHAATTNQPVISPKEFLFEPSLDEVVTYLETVMMEIALGQTILDSRLSQLASRFNAMRQAQDKAQDLADALKRDFFSAKRAQSDERIREVIAAMGTL